MNRVFGILCLAILFMGSVGCLPKSSDKNGNIQNAGNENKFKKWLNDTLSQLTSKGSLSDKQTITVTPDSLYMAVLNSYNIVVDSTYKEGNNELDYALDLLKRNHLMPARSFRLVFSINNYFSESSVKRFLYDYDSEIMKFNVVHDDTLIELKFNKGNLIGKRITKISN